MENNVEMKKQAYDLMTKINSNTNALNSLLTKYNDKITNSKKTNLVKVLALADEHGDTFIGDFYGAYKDIYNADGEDAATARLNIKNLLSNVGNFIKGGIGGIKGGTSTQQLPPSGGFQDPDLDAAGNPKKIMGLKKPIFFALLAVVLVIVVIIIIRMMKKS